MDEAWANKGSRMKASEIRKILRLARESGVEEIALGDLRVKFFRKKMARKTKSAMVAAPSPPLQTSTPSKSVIQELTSEGLPTDDELLLMSTPFYDEMQRLKAIQDEELSLAEEAV